jgi:hypothetical protein
MSPGRILCVSAAVLALGAPVSAARECVPVEPGAVVVAAAPAAPAQETMEFTPVPEESMRVLERRRLGNAPAAPRVPSAPARPQPLSRAGDVMRIGSDIHIEKDQVVEGDVFALQGDVRVDGHVRGNVASTGGDVYLGPDARVDGDVLCVGGQLHEEPGAWVGGQRVTALHGEHGQLGRRLRHRLPSSLALDYVSRIGELFGAVIWLLVWMAVAWGVTRFAPLHTGTAVATLEREPGMSLLIGFLTALLLAPSAVAMALVVAILCITIIGIPLAVGVVLAYAALLVVLTGWGLIVAMVPLGKQVAVRAGGGTWRPPSAAATPVPPDPSAAAGTQPSGAGMVTAAPAVSLTRAAIYGVMLVHGVFVASQALDLIPFMRWLGTLLCVLWWLANVLLVMIGAGALLRSKFGQGSEGQWWPMRKRPPSFLGTPPAPVETVAAPPTP